MSSANGIQNINMDVIEIEWDGPYTFEQSQQMSKGSDYGLYQIYGTHAVAGPNTLLYIGQSNSRRFNVRIPEHEQSDRFHWEPSELCIYFGRLGSLTPIRDPLSKQWEEQIDRTERLLIFTCTPPYNSQIINGPGNMPDTIILNHGKRHRLPFAITSLALTSSFGTSGWAVHGPEITG